MKTKTNGRTNIKAFRYSNQTQSLLESLIESLQLWSSDSCKEELFLEVSESISNLCVSIQADQNLYTDDYQQYFKQYKYEVLDKIKHCSHIYGG